MKKLVSLLTTFALAMFPIIARAGGDAYYDSGCGSEPLPEGCGEAFFWSLLVLIVLVVVVVIYDTYMMKTSPAYRARSEQMRREQDQRHRR